MKHPPLPSWAGWTPLISRRGTNSFLVNRFKRCRPHVQVCRHRIPLPMHFTSAKQVQPLLHSGQAGLRRAPRAEPWNGRPSPSPRLHFRPLLRRQHLSWRQQGCGKVRRGSFGGVSGVSSGSGAASIPPHAACTASLRAELTETLEAAGKCLDGPLSARVHALHVRQEQLRQAASQAEVASIRTAERLAQSAAAAHEAAQSMRTLPLAGEWPAHIHLWRSKAALDEVQEMLAGNQLG